MIKEDGSNFCSEPICYSSCGPRIYKLYIQHSITDCPSIRNGVQGMDIKKNWDSHQQSENDEELDKILDSIDINLINIVKLLNKVL